MNKKVFPAQILSGIYQIALGLLPVGLCIWYYQTLVAHQIEKVYFTYSDGLLFASDALALVAVLAWLGQKLFTTASTKKTPNRLRLFLNQLYPWPNGQYWGLAFCLLVSLSILWAADRQVSFFVSLHFWLVFGVFLSIKDQANSTRALSIGFCAALGMQIVIGFWQFGAQSTAFLTPLGLNWPGQLEPAMRGASIVELPNGVRWLRVYGSLPHPNLLGGFTLMFLSGPAARFLFDKKHPAWALALLAGGTALLVLTFSRSAWAGLATVGLVVALRGRKLPDQRMLAAGLAVLTGGLSAAGPLYPLIFTRAGAGAAATEEFSNAGRIWLTGQALNIIKDHPLTGVGAGNFILEYARRAPYGYLLEPVHNLPLLVIAELGLAGAVIGIGLGVSIFHSIRKAAQPENILFSAMLIGLLVTSFFDHYLWTLAPGRMMLGLAFGLWAAHAKQDQETNHVTDPL